MVAGVDGGGLGTVDWDGSGCERKRDMGNREGHEVSNACVFFSFFLLPSFIRLRPKLLFPLAFLHYYLYSS
jgi:hypothetical protein